MTSPAALVNARGWTPSDRWTSRGSSLGSARDKFAGISGASRGCPKGSTEADAPGGAYLRHFALLSRSKRRRNRRFSTAFWLKISGWSAPPGPSRASRTFAPKAERHRSGAHHPPNTTPRRAFPLLSTCPFPPLSSHPPPLRTADSRARIPMVAWRGAPGRPWWLAGPDRPRRLLFARKRAKNQPRRFGPWRNCKPFGSYAQSLALVARSDCQSRRPLSPPTSPSPADSR
jgi:hypothetical protein